MPLFGSKKVPAYVPQTGAITLTRAQFMTMMRTTATFRKYSQAVGVTLAAQALDDCFTENLRGMAASGFWQFGTSANFGNPTTLRFPDDSALKVFFDAVGMLFDFDLQKIQGRATYLNGLLGKATSGLLSAALANDTEPEASYYTAPAPSPQALGTPVVPPKPQALIDQAKALAWLTHGVTGDRSAFNRMLLTRTRTDGTFPFGADRTLLYTAWQAMVPIAPTYRGWNNAASMQKYPSNVGGLKLLDDVMKELSLMAMPARGDQRWYDLALYLLGAVITVQGFTDGNKRASRFAYVLMLLSGGVPIRVPNNVLGSQLGDMM